MFNCIILLVAREFINFFPLGDNDFFISVVDIFFYTRDKI